MRAEVASPVSPTSPASLRAFRGVCDLCLRDVPGTLELDGGLVRQRKVCPEHGARHALLSRNGERYARYDRSYHTLFPPDGVPTPPVDSYFAVTNRCNQACDYCLVEANRVDYYGDYDLARFDRELPGLTSKKVGLVGGEPAMHPRFFDLVARIAAAGKTAVVFTNGLAFADERMAERLVAASQRRCIVRFTFEGFGDGDYAHLRIPHARQKKLDALAHLARHGAAITLAHTITIAEQADRPHLRRIMRAIISYAMGQRAITGVTFSAVAALGALRGRSADDEMPVDEVMDEIVRAMPLPIDRRHVYLAQRITHAVARLFGLPMCVYHQAALLLRAGDGWHGLDHFLDCERLEARLDTRLDGWPASRAGIFAALASDLALTARPARAPALAKLGLGVLPLFLGGLDYREIPDGILPINAGTVCDPHNFDATVARRCEKLAYSAVDGDTVVETVSQMVMRHLGDRELRTLR